MEKYATGLLTNTITGVAFLSMPFHFFETGIVMTIVSALGVYILENISLEIMLRCWTNRLKNSTTEEKEKENKNKKGHDTTTTLFVANLEIQEIFEETKSKALNFFYHLFVLLSCYGTLIAFTTTLADAVIGLIKLRWEFLVTNSLRTAVIFIFALLEFPLSVFVDFHFQAIPSTISMLCLAGITICIIGDFFEKMAKEELPCCGVTYSDGGGGYTPIPTTIVTFVFAFTCQMNVFPIYNYIFNGMSLLNNNKFGPEEIKRMMGKGREVNITSTTLALVIYLAIGLFGYFDFLTAILPNIEDNYATANPWGITIRCLLIIKMYLTYPLLFWPTLEALSNLLGLGNSLDYGKNEKRMESLISSSSANLEGSSSNRLWTIRIFASLLIILSACAISIPATDLSFILSLVGAVTDVFISLALPAILAYIMNILTERGDVDMIILVITSIIISVLAILGLIMGKT